MELPLPPESKSALLALHRQSKERKFCDRIKMIILLDKGFTYNQVAEILLVDEKTVVEWRNRFLAAQSIDEFKRTHYHTPCSRLSQDQIHIIRDYIANEYLSNSSMLIAFIQQEFGIVYSPSGVRKLLHNLGYSYKQLNLFPGDANLEKQARFIDDYTQLEAEMTPKTAILFLDGVHPVHNTRPSMTWSLKGVRDYIRSNTGRERVNINGAYDPHRQEVITHISEKVNTESTIELLDLVKQKYPKDYTIHLFADNARYYHSLGLRNYLAENPRFQLYYLPPYSPNLNLIERLWKFMRKNVLDAKYYPTAQTFRQAIIEFFAQIHTQRAELETFIGYRFQTLT